MEQNTCKYITEVLMQTGACDVNVLLETCKAKPNCPKKLKAITADDLKLFIENENDSLSFKNNKVCLVKLEKNISEQILSAIRKEGSYSLDSAVDLIKDSDKSMYKYIQAGNIVGVIDYVNRNDEEFEIKEGKIYAKSKTVFTTKHDEAVKYFLDVLKKKGELKLKALSGHWNQASPEVKEIVKNTNEELFKNFLLQNSYFFEITSDGTVKIRDQGSSSLNIIIEGDDSVCKTVKFFISALSKKGNNRTLQQLVSYVNLRKDPEIIGTISSNSPADIEHFLNSHPSIFEVANDKVSLLISNATVEDAAVLNASSYAGVSNGSSETSLPIKLKENKQVEKKSQNNGILLRRDSGEFLVDFEDSRLMYENFCGVGFAASLKSLLSSIQVKHLSKVQLVWFDVGKKPSVKVLITNPEMKFAIHELSDLPTVSENFLNSSVTKLWKISSNAFGVLGHLHTFRVNFLNETPIGMTMFHQVHSTKAASMEEKKSGNLRVILHDRLSTYSNDLYSYIRTISANLSRHHHVFIVDFNGRITGYDPKLPEVVGRSRCIKCPSSEYRYDAILEAFSHNPDCIVTNCLDIMDEKLFNLIKDVAQEGIQVVMTLNHQHSYLID